MASLARATSQAWRPLAAVSSRSVDSQVKPSPRVCHSMPRCSASLRSPTFHLPLFMNCTTPTVQPRAQALPMTPKAGRRLALAVPGVDQDRATAREARAPVPSAAGAPSRSVAGAGRRSGMGASWRVGARRSARRLGSARPGPGPEVAFGRASSRTSRGFRPPPRAVGEEEQAVGELRARVRSCMALSTVSPCSSAQVVDQFEGVDPATEVERRWSARRAPGPAPLGPGPGPARAAGARPPTRSPRGRSAMGQQVEELEQLGAVPRGRSPSRPRSTRGGACARAAT